MTQDESHDLIEWIEDGQHRSTTKALKKFSRGAVLAFLFLLAVILYVRHEDAARADKALKARIAVANSQRQAIIKSGSVVAVEGCNQRFKDRVEVRSILDASKKASLAAYNRGEITKARLNVALQFYDDRLKGLPLPDCRKSQNALTTDINDVPPTPKALYPGSPQTTSGGEGADPGARPNPKRGE